MNKQDKTAAIIGHESKIQEGNIYGNDEDLLNESITNNGRTQNTNVTSVPGENNNTMNNCMSIFLMKLMNSKYETSCPESISTNNVPLPKEEISSELIEKKTSKKAKDIDKKINRQEKCHNKKHKTKNNKVELMKKSEQYLVQFNCSEVEVKGDIELTNTKQPSLISSNQTNGENSFQESIIDQKDELTNTKQPSLISSNQTNGENSFQESIIDQKDELTNTKQPSLISSNQTNGENSFQESIIDQKDQNIVITMNRNSSKVRRGIIFLNKKRNFFKNLIFAKKDKMSHNDIKTKHQHQVNNSSKSLNSIADPSVEEKSKPTFYSTVEISKDDTKIQQSNSEDDSKLNNFKEIKPIDEDDCEMVILFMNQGKEIQKVTLNKKDVENKIIETNSAYDIPLTKGVSEIIKAKLHNFENINCADKTTSTSNLKLYTRTNSKENTTNEIFICSTSCSKTGLNYMTEQCLSQTYAHLESESDIRDSCKETPNVSFLLESNKCNTKVDENKNLKEYNEVIEKKIQLQRNAFLEHAFNKMNFTNFMNPHGFVHNNTQEQEECKFEKTHLNNVYASFKKNYIPVTSRTGTVNSQVSDSRSDSQKTEDTSSVSCISNNFQRADFFNMSDDIFNRNTNTVQNEKNLSNSDCSDSPFKENEVSNNACNNDSMYNHDAKAYLNLFNHKLQFLDKYYEESMKRTFQSVLVNDHNSIVNQCSEYDYQNESNLFKPDENFDKHCKKYENPPNSTENENNIIKLNGDNSNIQTDFTCKMSISRNSFKSDKNNTTVCDNVTNSLLSRQFKRDYISVRGKSMKIQTTDSSIVTHKTKHFKVTKEKSIYNIEKIYKEITNDTYKLARDNLMKRITPVCVEKATKSKSSLSSNEYVNNRTVKLSSKLSLCISQETIDDDLYDDILPDRFIDSNLEKQSSSDEENFLEKNNLTYLEHNRPVFPRIYSDFSIENKCNPKAYKYLFNNFHK